jgi:hypothetical protein
MILKEFKSCDDFVGHVDPAAVGVIIAIFNQVKKSQ